MTAHDTNKPESTRTTATCTELTCTDHTDDAVTDAMVAYDAANANDATDIQLFIVSICGKKSSIIRAERSEDIFSIKAKILQECTLDWNLSECMRILYARDILNEANTLTHYGITNGSTLFVLKKCRVRTCRHNTHHAQPLDTPEVIAQTQYNIDEESHDHTQDAMHIATACKRLKQNGVEVAPFKLRGWTLQYNKRHTGTSGDWYATSPGGKKYRSYKALQKLYKSV